MNVCRRVQLLKRAHRPEPGEARPSEQRGAERGRPEVVRRFFGELRAVEPVSESCSLLDGDLALLEHHIENVPPDPTGGEHAWEPLAPFAELPVAILRDRELPDWGLEESQLLEHVEERREQILHDGNCPFRSSVEKPLDGFCCIL